MANYSTYVSKIEDIELIKGDSSPIWFFGLPDSTVLSADWTAKFAIVTDFGTSAVIERTLPKNSGTGAGDTYTAGTKFVFQILPSESALLDSGLKYIAAVEIKNDVINYRAEIAQFKVKVKPGVIS